MKNRLHFYLIVAIGLPLIIVNSCKKENVKIIPEVSTTGVTIITPVSASCGGNIILSGSSEIGEEGVCWSKVQSPSVSDNKTIEKPLSSSAGFESKISGLTSNATYFVRAYATSDAGTAYGNELSFTAPVDHSGEIGNVTDIEGNVYQTIGIGSQIWTRENMRTTTLNDGTTIPIAKCYRIWSFLFSPGYCWYNNDELTFKNTYGALYNWYTVNTMKLCPTGLYVPGDEEWTILETYLGGSSIAGGKMKETGTANWKDPNNTATNESGFTALPCGYRGDLASYINIGENSVYWTSNLATSDKASYISLNFKGSEITRGINPIEWGASVRCVKN